MLNIHVYINTILYYTLYYPNNLYTHILYWTGAFQNEGRLNAIYRWFAGSFLVFINSDTIKK